MKHITVLGSFMTDLMARGEHLPQPGETVKGSAFKLGPGGKGSNQAIAAHKSGADVTLVAKIGTDTFADVAMNIFNSNKMNTEYIFKTDKAPTGTAIIMVDENTSQNAIVITPGSNETFDDNDIEQIKPLIKKSGFILAQLETNPDVTVKAFRFAKENGVTTVLNPAPVCELSDEFLSLVDIITPNEIEAGMLTGVEIKSVDDAVKAADVFFEKGVKQVIITMGKTGVFAATPEKYEVVGNYDVKVMDTTGAGDAFNGGCLAALADGKDLWEAIRFGNVVSNLAVTRVGAGAAMPEKTEIEEFIKQNGLK